jgi:hypothetical protein
MLFLSQEKYFDNTSNKLLDFSYPLKQLIIFTQFTIISPLKCLNKDLQFNKQQLG